MDIGGERPGAGSVVMPSALERLADADLLERVRHGDERAFSELYSRHRDVARRMAAAWCRPAEVDDLVDVAFERMLRALRRGHGPTGAFRAYLFVILRRLAAAQAGRGRECLVEVVPEPADATRPGALDRTERELITSAFESLPSRWQAVLWHTAVEGDNPRDLATRLGMSPNAVSALAYRAREKLRQAYLQAHLQVAPRPECEPHRSNLGAYVRDGLGARERATTGAHLERCPSCQALLDELLDVNRLLSRAVLPLVGVEATGRLAKALAATAKGAEAGGWWSRQAVRFAALEPLGAMAGGLVAASALFLGMARLPHVEARLPAAPGGEASAPAVDLATPDLGLADGTTLAVGPTGEPHVPEPESAEPQQAVEGDPTEDDDAGTTVATGGDATCLPGSGPGETGISSSEDCTPATSGEDPSPGVSRPGGGAGEPRKPATGRGGADRGASPGSGELPSQVSPVGSCAVASGGAGARSCGGGGAAVAPVGSGGASVVTAGTPAGTAPSRQPWPDATAGAAAAPAGPETSLRPETTPGPETTPCPEATPGP